MWVFFPVRSCRSSVWCSTATAALQTEPVISCVLSISRTKQQVYLASFNCSESMKGIFYQGAAVSSLQAAERGDKLVWEYCSNSNLAGECSCLLNWLSYWKHMKLCFDSTSRHSISDFCYSWNISEWIWGKTASKSCALCGAQIHRAQLQLSFYVSTLLKSSNVARTC